VGLRVGFWEFSIGAEVGEDRTLVDTFICLVVISVIFTFMDMLILSPISFTNVTFLRFPIVFNVSFIPRAAIRYSIVHASSVKAEKRLRSPVLSASSYEVNCVHDVALTSETSTPNESAIGPSVSGI